MSFHELEKREAELAAQIAEANGRAARIVESERIAAELGWKFDDLTDPDAGLKAAVEAPVADLASVVRRLPQEVGMSPAARARFLKKAGIL